MIALSKFSEEELFVLYRGILKELRDRGVIRTSNAPAGDYAEYLVAKVLGGKISGNAAEKSWDVLIDGARCQVKCRVVSTPKKSGELQLSPMRTLDFDALIIVLLDASTYRVQRCVQLPVGVVQELGTFNKHVNGWIVRATEGVLTHHQAVDLTHRFASTEASAGPL